MKLIALVLGVFGGFIGVLFSAAPLGFDPFGLVIPGESPEVFFGGAVVAFFFSIIGLIGGALAFTSPTVSGWMMLLAAVIGFISVFLLYLIPGIILLVAGILAILASGQGATAR